ncbi:hypothetical protein CHH60_20320, partial [Paenibacillus sp. 7523-1]
MKPMNLNKSHTAQIRPLYINDLIFLLLNHLSHMSVFPLVIASLHYLLNQGRMMSALADSF